MNTQQPLSTITHHWLDIGYSCRLKVYEYRADFDLFSVVIEAGENGHQYTEKGAVNNLEMTTDLDEAEVFAHGSMKWDGCADFTIGEPDCALHTCDREPLVNIGVALARVWDLAFQLVPTAKNR